MTAYAALVSVMHIIDQIEHHPRPPISLDKNQVESLTEKVTFLQEFLEGYNSHSGYSSEADALEMRIVDAAYAAEDVIESHIVDQIHGGERISSVNLHRAMQKVMEDMDSLSKEVMEMEVQHQLHRSSAISGGSLRSSFARKNTTMVGFDDFLFEIMDKLCGGELDRQIVPIVGMGGTGKTTLATNVYAKPLIIEHFDLCAWTTISQEYDTREMFRVVLSQFNKEGRRDQTEYELGEVLYKHLTGRRYLIVMDDVWSIEAWDKVKFFFPDNHNGSRIMITTRISNLAFQLTGSYGFQMKFLDEDESWNLFSEIVFGKEDCPVELEEIGKKIVKNCKGLPLSIVVTGGLLTKYEGTREYWEHIVENTSSAINSEDGERCLQILYASYKELPIHLKPCFLYMGLFQEDSEIRVSRLIKLWVAEGFLKPTDGKSLEVVAEEYLADLVDRNLVLVRKLGSTGSIKYCKVHDLLRDLCLREAEKQRFYNVAKQHSLLNLQGINTQRRISILDNASQKKVLDALQSTSLARSLIWDERDPPPINCRLLRILNTSKDHSYGGGCFLENILRLVNSRHLAIRVNSASKFVFPICLPWNLHTLIIDGYSGSAPVEIWKMSQLRHVVVYELSLPYPFSRRDDIVLENLQTLGRILNFKCGEEVVKRIPNIKKLDVEYTRSERAHHHRLVNLERLHKLTSFRCCGFVENLTFPRSLTKLTLVQNVPEYWEDILGKVGSLPFLEKLKLMFVIFNEGKWETVEGQFPSLRFLLIQVCNLENWTTDSTHFPRLEHIVIKGVFTGLEIPSSIGEIPTLETIELEYCNKSMLLSAKKILDEQEELGNESLHVRARITNAEENEGLESLASLNLHVSRF